MVLGWGGWLSFSTTSTRSIAVATFQLFGHLFAFGNEDGVAEMALRAFAVGGKMAIARDQQHRVLVMAVGGVGPGRAPA